MHQASVAVTRLATLTPDRALLLLTTCVLLIYVELNRPGWIFPGAVGLLGSLLALKSILRLDLKLAAVALVCGGVALLLLGVRRNTPLVVAIAATLSLCLGFDHLIAPSNLQVHGSVAVGCGVILGASTWILTRIARRARTNKGLD